MGGQVAEGVETTRAARQLSQQTGVELPIADAVHALLFEGKPPLEAVKGLMTRAGRDELES
jgi:glycerol-3-phosphate dehydrogenase (NAD(P)+)